MLLVLTFLPGSFLALVAQEPLFTFVQTSDSQPASSADQRAFEEGMDTIAESGTSGALLPHRVDFVVFAGDLTDGNSTSEWSKWVATIDARLTANDIPVLCVPGNHDRSGGSDFTRYKQFIADTKPWSASCAALTGHNGISITTGIEGLRFVGVNNTNGDYNVVSSSDVTATRNLVDAAVANDENVFVMAHHPHNAESRTPLLAALETPGVIGYLRGHSGSPHATRGLSGVDNDDAFDVCTNALYEDGALVYFEAFTTELHAYVLKLANNPTRLPSRVVIPLVFDLRPSGGEPPPPPGTRFEPVADAQVGAGRPTQNYGTVDELRLRDDATSSWKSYLRFDLSSIGNQTITSARLRLFCTDSSSSGGALYQSPTSWSETSITWSNAPAPGALVRSSQSASENQWSEFDVRAALVGGARSFALVSTSTNGCIYSSREGAHPPELLLELAPPPPLAITDVVPSSIDVFVPGTDQTVDLEGTGFTEATVVEFDGTPLSAGSFTVVDANLITLDLPPAAVGTHGLTVRDGTRSDSDTIRTVLPSTPKLQIGTGDPDNPIESGQPVRILVAGPVGAKMVVSMSRTLSPSVNAALSLAIGANFTDLRIATILTVPTAGFIETQFPATTSTAVTVYAQATAWIGSPPFATSNVQSFQVLP